MSELVITCLNSHIQHYTNALTLSVMVGKLMGGALGMALMGPIHRHAGFTPHLTVGPSPALRHANWADGAARAVWQFILHHSEVHKHLWWVGRVLAVWGTLCSSYHSPRSPGRVLYHDIRAQNVVWNSIGGHARPTEPVWTGAQNAPCVTITH